MLLGKCDLGFMWKRRVIEEPSVGASLMLIRIILPFIHSLLHFSSAFTSSSYALLMHLLVAFTSFLSCRLRKSEVYHTSAQTLSCQKNVYSSVILLALFLGSGAIPEYFSKL